MRQGPVVWVGRPSYTEAFYKCHKCKRGFVYGDSLQRHNALKHPKKHQREQAKRMRAANEQAYRAAKHKELCSEIVRTALAFYRRGFKDSNVVDLKESSQFLKACAALERFETK